MSLKLLIKDILTRLLLLWSPLYNKYLTNYSKMGTAATNRYTTSADSHRHIRSLDGQTRNMCRGFPASRPADSQTSQMNYPDCAVPRCKNLSSFSRDCDDFGYAREGGLSSELSGQSWFSGAQSRRRASTVQGLLRQIR